MGTKNNPGQFDCYANALPDEPMFILLGRDPVAPFLVSLWAKVRTGDYEAARAVFEKLLSKEFMLSYLTHPEGAKADEAHDCMSAMFEWRQDNEGAWRKPAANTGSHAGESR